MKINDLEVKKLNEGPIGTAIGAGLGAMAGGPLGAAAGGVAGNWVGDKLSKAAGGLKSAGKSFMQGFKGEKPAEQPAAPVQIPKNILTVIQKLDAPKKKELLGML
jgi:hypothetical protein